MENPVEILKLIITFYIGGMYGLAAHRENDENSAKIKIILHSLAIFPKHLQFLPVKIESIYPCHRLLKQFGPGYHCVICKIV